MEGFNANHYTNNAVWRWTPPLPIGNYLSIRWFTLSDNDATRSGGRIWAVYIPQIHPAWRGRRIESWAEYRRSREQRNVKGLREESIISCMVTERVKENRKNVEKGLFEQVLNLINGESFWSVFDPNVTEDNLELSHLVAQCLEKCSLVGIQFVAFLAD